jgi:CPA1 family monovalent cation:H+ antiporter
VSSDDRAQRLRSVPLFADLEAPALDRIASSSVELELPSGSVLIERGLPGSGLFLILDGRVGVELRSRTVELGPGEFVGELSLLTDDPRRVARVKALTDLRCLTVSRGDMAEILRTEPSVALAMLSTLARRLSDAAGFRPAEAAADD